MQHDKTKISSDDEWFRGQAVVGLMLCCALAACAEAPTFDLPQEPINEHPHYDGDGDGLVMVASESRALVGSPSTGCGLTPPYAAGTTTQISMTLAGQARSFYWQVPSTYLNSVPQRLAFGLHGRGGSGQTMYSQGVWHVLSGLAVYPDALGLPYCQGQRCWDEQTNGNDMAFINALVAWIEANYCVDSGRVVSYGFSSGAIFTDIIGCVHSPPFVAIYSVEGLLASNIAALNYSNADWDAGCLGPIGFGGQYNYNDTTIPQASAFAQLSYWVTSDNDGGTPDAAPWSALDAVSVTAFTGGLPNPPAQINWATFDAGGHGWNNPFGAEACGGYLSLY